MKPTTAIVGAAGEHLVVGELLRRGHIAAMAPQGAPNMDVLIADAQGEKLFSIQVKTRTSVGGDKGWHMGKKHEEIVNDRLFYVFVDLSSPDGKAPSFFIIPSEKVAEVVKETHAAWLRNPGKNGRVRKDSNMRRIRPDYSKIYTAETIDERFVSGWMKPYCSAWNQFTLG